MRRWLVVTALAAVLTPFSAPAGTAVAPLLRAYLAQRTGDLEQTLAALQEALQADPESEVIRA